VKRIGFSGFIQWDRSTWPFPYFHQKHSAKGVRLLRVRTFTSAILAALLVARSIPAQTVAAPLADPSPPVVLERDVSLKKILPNFWDDQKKIWSFPAQVAKGSHLLPVFAVLGTTAALTTADPVEARYFRSNSSSFQ
jgi:hypothetical protein